MQTSLDQLLEEISFRRRKELRSKGKCDKSAESGCSVQSTTYWTDLFVRHFLFQTEYEVDRDDLLFFIRKTSVNNLCYKSRNLVDVSIELCPFYSLRIIGLYVPFGFSHLQYLFANIEKGKNQH